MKAPSWSEFDRKTSNLEKEIDKNIRSFKNNHPLLDRALKQSFSFLPAPFNTYAQNIYDTFSGSEEDKSSQVLDYINTVKSKGEGYYYSQHWEEDYKTKLKELDRQLQIALNDWIAIAIKNDQQKYDKALEQFAMPWFNKGLEFANLGQNEDAIACYKKAIEIYPRFPEAWNNLGVIFQGRGNYKTALYLYNKALTFNPNYIVAQRNKAILYNLIQTHIQSAGDQ
jgi:tetratricopeptide (TPR) repeat protein